MGGGEENPPSPHSSPCSNESPPNLSGEQLWRQEREEGDEGKRERRGIRVTHYQSGEKGDEANEGEDEGVRKGGESQ